MNKRIKKKKAKAKVSFKPMSSEALLRKQLTALEKQIKAANSLKNPTKIKAKIERREKTVNVKRNRYLQPVRKPLQYNEHSQKEEVGALIAKYHDYIDRGIIKPRSFVDNYDQASWMSSIISEPEMKKVLKQADKWMAMSAEKRAQRLANEPIIDF